MVKTKAAACSDIGVSRKHNEDAFVCLSECGLFVVADGMGGLDNGDRASNLACSVIKRLILEGSDLAEAVKAARSALKLACSRLAKSKMDTTILALHVKNNRAEMIWAGDSRLYRLSEKGLQQLTEDHTFTQGLLKAGIISDDEARQHPQRNVVTRSLGNESGKFQRKHFAVHPGERFLLSSDGIHGALDISELNAVLQDGRPPEETAHDLIHTAMGAGSQDNVTALILDILEIHINE